MAGDGDDVLGRKTLVCSRMLAADFGEGEAVGGGIEVFEAAGVLDGLEGDAADAGLLQGEVDDLADLVVVEALLQGDDERGGDVERLSFSRALRRMRRRSAPRSCMSGSRSKESNWR